MPITFVEAICLIATVIFLMCGLDFIFSKLDYEWKRLPWEENVDAGYGSDFSTARER